MKFLKFSIILSLLIFLACEKKAEKTANSLPLETKVEKEIPHNLQTAMKAVEPFFKKMGEPKSGEWLAAFREEGQTFDQYFNGNPTLPTAERRTIYIQPIGKFTDRQRRVIKITAGFMQSFFNLPIKLLRDKKFQEPLSLKNYRINKFFHVKQIRTGYVLDEILRPNLPTDAAAMIAFTNEDLYPDENFNFVFGQASLQNRVGVWSLYRLDDEVDYKKFLERTLKIAVHETGHMFSMAHCTKYECVMSGSNHLLETNAHPLDTCPECVAKICWLANYEPQKRYENLTNFCKENGLKAEAETFRKKAEAVSNNK